MNDKNIERGKILVQMLSLISTDEVISDLKKAIEKYEYDKSQKNLKEIKKDITIVNMRFEIESKGLNQVMNNIDKNQMGISLIDLNRRIN